MAFTLADTTAVGTLTLSHYTEAVTGGTLHLVVTTNAVMGSVETPPALSMVPNSILPATQYVANVAGTTGTLAAGDMEGSQNCTLAASGGTTPTYTTRTAAQIIAGVPGWTVGDSYLFRLINTNSGTATLSGGSGVTITGTATAAANTWRDFYVTYTGAGAVGMQQRGIGTTS